VSYPPPPGGPPPPPGNPYPPQGYSGPQQPWPPQQPWDPSLPPKKRGNGWKWALGLVALLVVIGVTAAVTIWVIKDGDDGGPTPTGDTFGLASADDKGPANIITEDPSCAAWKPISQTLTDIQGKGWNDRDPSIPASAWSPAQRTSYEAVAQAMRNAADQTVAMAKLTPNRIMRELYEQFIVYARAYSDAVPNYEPADNHLAGVAITTQSAAVNVCNSIDRGSAQARAPLVSPPAPPTEVAPVQDPNSPRRLLESPDPTCAKWDQLLDKFNNDSAAWRELNPNTSASDWSPDQAAIVNAVIPVMTEYADNLEKLGRGSGNPVFEDFATFAAQYRRAYAAGLPTYTSADYYISRTAIQAESTIFEACKAAGA
jgi:hypothetical protein